LNVDFKNKTITNIDIQGVVDALLKLLDWIINLFRTRKTVSYC